MPIYLSPYLAKSTHGVGLAIISELTASGERVLLSLVTQHSFSSFVASAAAFLMGFSRSGIVLLATLNVFRGGGRAGYLPSLRCVRMCPWSLNRRYIEKKLYSNEHPLELGSLGDTNGDRHDRLITFVLRTIALSKNFSQSLASN